MASALTLHKYLRRCEWKLEEIKELLEKDSSSINEVDFPCETPLQRVLSDRKCSNDIVKLLLDHGADVNTKGKPPPLTRALLQNKNAAVIKLLLEKGADLNVIEQSLNPSALCLALSCVQSNDILQLILDAGCSIDSCGRHCGSVLRCATENIELGLKEDTLQLLIKKGAGVNELDTEGRSPLCYALGRGNKLCVIELLLKVGGSLNACRKHATPLQCVTGSNEPYTPLRADVVKMLLEYLKKIPGRFADPKPLQCALTWYDCETNAIELLLGHFRNVQVVQKGNLNTLLHFAVCRPPFSASVVKLLIKLGVEVAAVNGNGDTALHLYVRNDYVLASIVQTLIVSGSPLNLNNASFENPLRIAAEHLKDVDIFKMLFFAGARIGAYGSSSLIPAIDRCDPSLQLNSKGVRAKKSLDYCKTLMKCYFLENPDFDFQSLIEGHGDYEVFLQFGIDCIRELRKLESKNVGGDQTLREFLGGRKVKNCDFHQLLRIIVINKFPLFFDIIAGKIGRSSMQKTLPEVEVYVYKNSAQESVSVSKKRVALNDACVREIADRLGDEDLLRFISAFHKMDRCICTTQDSEDKGRGEHSEQCRKRPRLQ